MASSVTNSTPGQPAPESFPFRYSFLAVPVGCSNFTKPQKKLSKIAAVNAIPPIKNSGQKNLPCAKRAGTRWPQLSERCCVRERHTI